MTAAVSWLGTPHCTGREVTPAELTFYRLDWQLADIAEYARWLGGPHQRNGDTELAWTSLVRDLTSDVRS